MQRSVIPLSFRLTIRPLSTRTLSVNCLLRKTFSPITESLQASNAAPFTSSSRLLARKGKGGGQKKDNRISEFTSNFKISKNLQVSFQLTSFYSAQIRYHLTHQKTPRPLRFSRLRFLRHWTIHRAWQLFRAKQRTAQELELERQYNSMREACEALRLMDERGMAGQEGGKDVGRLYRIAMEKKGIWDNVPIEYARIQMEYPSREGWNHDWTR